MSAPIDLSDLEMMSELANEITRWHIENLVGEQECMRCGDSMHTPSDLEPTPLCNLCAQFVAGHVTDLIDHIVSLDNERDSLRANVEAQDARIKGLEATIAEMSRVPPDDLIARHNETCDTYDEPQCKIPGRVEVDWEIGADPDDSDPPPVVLAPAYEAERAADPDCRDE